MEIERGAQNQHGLFGGTGAELDDGGSLSGGANHRGRITLEDGLLGGGEVILGQLGNLFEERGARSVIEQFWRQLLGPRCKAIEHLAGVVVQRKDQGGINAHDLPA